MDTISIQNNQIILNGKTFHHQLNVAQLLALQNISQAQFSLFTCECGVPGCAGFEELVTHEKSSDTVKWTFPDQGYPVDKKEYIFDTVQWDNSLALLHQQILKEEKASLHHVENAHLSKTQKVNTMQDTIEWHHQHFKKHEMFMDILQTEFSHLLKDYYFTYDAITSQYSYPLPELLLTLMNHDGAKVRETAYALEDFLLGHKEALEVITKEGLERYGLETRHILPWDIDIEDTPFDWAKLGLHAKASPRMKLK